MAGRYETTPKPQNPKIGDLRFAEIYLLLARRLEDSPLSLNGSHGREVESEAQ